MENISTKEQATLFSSLFWIVMTLFRFIFAFVKMKPSKKLRICIYTQIIFSFFILIFVDMYGWHKFALYFAAIAYGISFSSMFGLFFVFPTEWNM
jgi:hypothetical protein